MTRLADRIMKRLSTRGRGRWVCTPKDFLDLGSREAVDQAVNRLSILTPNRRAKLTPLSGTAEVVPVADRGDPRGFV